MYPFKYLRPASLDEAARILKENPDARLLAGGMSLLPAMKLRLNAASMLIDLARLPGLSGVERGRDEITVKALTRHADVEASSLIAQTIPALATTAGGIGDRQVRYRGTIGGSIANDDPAADYPAAVLGLGATLRTTGRSFRADDFFKGMFTTALDPTEILTEISFPIPSCAAYVKFAQPASRFALVGVFVCREASGKVRVAVTGAASSVFRATEIERSLEAEFTPGQARVAVSADQMNSDIHGDAEYRAHLVSVLAERAVAIALRQSNPA